MTIEEIKQLCSDYFNDNESELKMKEFFDLALRHIEAWEKIKKEIESLIEFNSEDDYISEAGCGMMDCLDIINKALSEIRDESN